MGKLFVIGLAGLATYLNDSYHLVPSIYREADGKREDITAIIVFLTVLVTIIVVGRMADRPKKIN